MNKINQRNLKFRNSSSSNQRSPRLGHRSEAQGGASLLLALPRPAEEKRSKVPPFSLQTRGPQQGHQTQILLTGTTGRSTQKCRCSPCFLLKTHNYQLNWAAAAGTPPLPTQGGQTFVVNSLPGRKTIFLKRNNLFRMKQNQLNCERMFEWQLLLSCVSHKKGIPLLFQQSCVHSTKQRGHFFFST